MKLFIFSIPLLAVFLVIFTGCSLFSGINQLGKEDTFSITYKANGADTGTVPSGSEEFEEGDSVLVKSPGSLSRSGFSFVEWNRRADGTGTGNTAGTWLIMPDYDVTLYAIWEAVE